MKTNDVWKRARRIPVMLITEGLCVGLVGGFVVLLYRVALTFCGRLACKDSFLYERKSISMCGVVLILAALAWIVGKLVKWEPMISGSGIPQVEGEIAGRLPKTGNACCRQNLQEAFCVCWVVFLLEEKVRRSNLEPWQDRGYPELWDGEKRREVFDDVAGRVRDFLLLSMHRWQV